MTEHKTGTREQWLAARLQLLQAEKELTRRGDDLARQRRELPWVRLDKDYRFDTESGAASIAGLFGGRSQLLVYHFMFDPGWDEGCPSCSSIADGFDKTYPHFLNHDVAFTAVSRAPLDKLLAYRDRMGWSFPWASSGGSDFNYDFHVTIDPSVTPVEYNYRNQAQLEQANIAWRDWVGEQPGMSAFALDDGVVYHTYSAYARGFDALWPMWQWLDRTPLGRDEGDWSWFHRHDEYDSQKSSAPGEASDYNSEIIEEFRANRGRVGGMWAGTTLLLLHHVGAKSGIERVTPLACSPRGGDRFAIWAANGGSPTHPNWYYNLKANPRITVEVGAQTFTVLAEELGDTARAELWPQLVAEWPKPVADSPDLGATQAKSARQFPVFLLTREDS
jgi:deazaflavin-dependent oxidoreductase (nitroreductase family)